MKWDGEWHITYEVFRDLGMAFAAVLVLIFVLVVGWFQSFAVPLVILAAHSAVADRHSAGARADGGVLHRHVHDRLHRRGRHHRPQLHHPGGLHRAEAAEGMPLDDAVVEAGVVRFRPMLLTAAAVVVGSSVILFDPIFQGLAISLMAGEVAATLLSRLAVPVVYYMIARRGRAEESAPGGPGARGERVTLSKTRRDLMTIERALRAMAGFFVMLSVALGYWVHPGFFLFTAFVGLNLFQSAFTNACPAMAIFRKLGLRECEPASASAGRR